MLTTAAIVVIVSFAYSVQAAFGFGAGLLAVPLLSLFIAPKDAIVIVLVFTTLSALVAVKLFRHIDWHKIRWLTPGIVAGVIVGLALFAVVDQRGLGLALAIYLIAYVLNDIFKPRILRDIARRMPVAAQGIVSGFAGGVIQGVMGTGGPMIVAYLKTHTNTINQFRASVLCVQFIANVLRMVFVGSTHFINDAVQREILITMPFCAAAIYGGYHLPKILSVKTFHAVINGLLLLAGASLLVKAML